MWRGKVNRSIRNSSEGNGTVHGLPTTFWGKLEQDDRGAVIEWHPLLDHCADVAAVAETLLSLPLWRARLSRLADRSDLDDVTRTRLAVLAAFHDIGKLNLGFQAKGRPELGSTAGHVKEALAALGEDVLRPRLEPLGRWGIGATGLLISSLCHHGQPYQVDACCANYQRTWWSPRFGLDPADGADALLAACRRWFPSAFEQGAPDLPESPAFEHAFAGLVTLADWIGSDTNFFAYSREGAADRIDFSRRMAGRIVEEMSLDIDPRGRSDRSDLDPFTRVAPEGYRPRPVQAAVSDLPDEENGAVTVIESDTGSGKTEAALAHFVRLYSRGSVDGLYFALPTRTAATQIFERVRAATRRAFAQPPPVVLAVPGYLRVDDAEGTHGLAPFEVLWPDRGRFRFRGWAAEHPKRFIVGAVAIGTIDQVLLSSLMVRHAHMRATALLRQLLVVDEVHASDAYMTRILEDVLARHMEAGGHALLLSATLGAETRARLLDPMGGTNRPTLKGATGTPYPLVSQRGSAGQSVSLAMQSDAPSRSVCMEPRPWLEDPDHVAACALGAARRGAKVLVIKNTVRDCVATQQSLERGAFQDRGLLFGSTGVPAPHHSRFARVDRESLDHSLEERLGKERPAGGCIVIATQTVQQSLDIDADLLITDLCPADVLLQRIGRLHRHPRDRRPPGFTHPRAVVVLPRQRDLGVLLNEHGKARHHHGLGSVYSDLRILEATWQLIERHPHWRVPEMNRILVEQSVHSEALQAISAKHGERWLRHAMQTIGAERGQSRQADLNVIDRTKPYSETSFPDTLERISTRLGEGDRRVRFQPPVKGPFGLSVRQLELRASWTTGVPDGETASVTKSAGGITRFLFGGRAFVYDRFGVRPDQLQKDHDDERR